MHAFLRSKHLSDFTFTFYIMLVLTAWTEIQEIWRNLCSSQLLRQSWQNETYEQCQRQYTLHRVADQAEEQDVHQK